MVMRYPWEEFGLTHRDLGFQRAGDLMLALPQRKLVTGEVAKWLAKGGGDPERLAANSRQALEEAKAKVASGEWHQSMLADFERLVTERELIASAYQFWQSILAGMEG